MTEENQTVFDNKGNILTYGTFDLFHIGHLKLLKRLKALGSKLIVGISTDEFNKVKGKNTIIPFAQRAEIVEAIKFVDLVIEEKNWVQKAHDIRKHDVDIFAMGDDWRGKFDNLNEICKVIYLPRTEFISSTEIKNALQEIYGLRVDEMSSQFDLLGQILEDLK